MFPITGKGKGKLHKTLQAELDAKGLRPNEGLVDYLKASGGGTAQSASVSGSATVTAPASGEYLIPGVGIISDPTTNAEYLIPGGGIYST